MVSDDNKLDAVELTRAELAVTQQLLKIVLNHLIQSAPNPREARETIARAADDLCNGYDIRGFGPDKTDAAREFMRHHATTILSEIGVER